MDLVATMLGRVGFRVRFSDGSTLCEADVTWDDVPRDRPIQALEVIDLRSGHAYVTLEKMPEYFFCNEAVSGSGGGVTMLTAKILGGLRTGSGVDEVRVEFAPKADGGLVPIVSTRRYSDVDFDHPRSSLRPGALGN